jgi:hypothetical protein
VIARALLFLAAVFVIVLPCAGASAQTTPSITLTIGTKIERREGRDSGLKQTDINYNDCMADDALDVTVTPKGGTATLEVWSGKSSSTCSDATYRGDHGDQCWKVQTVSAISTTTNVSLKVRDLLPQSTGEEGDELCNALAKDSDLGSGTLKLYFILTSGSDVVNSTTAPLSLKYDLVGPDAPDGVTLSIGDTRLFPEWEAPDATLDTSGYELYCEPIESLDNCMGTLLKAGEHPPVNDGTLKTTKIGKRSTSGEVSGLTNYTPYACAVAGIDGLSNMGVLSDLVCEAPQPVNGYFKTFRAAGGTAGGGYCSFGRRAATPTTALLSLFALGALFVRRQRRRSS